MYYIRGFSIQLFGTAHQQNNYRHLDLFRNFYACRSTNQSNTN